MKGETIIFCWCDRSSSQASSSVKPQVSMGGLLRHTSILLKCPAITTILRDTRKKLQVSKSKYSSFFFFFGFK